MTDHIEQLRTELGPHWWAHMLIWTGVWAGFLGLLIYFWAVLEAVQI